MTGRLGILGASGFVGSALCERLFFDGVRDFVPFVHSTGNAWRVARLPLDIRPLDILDRTQVRSALASCDMVVNCALGSDAAKLRGLANVLAEARRLRLKKFVHISSIAIYGQDPAPDSVTEAGKPAPGRNLYGILKLRQDQMVMRLHRAGVPCFILCPGNVTGPYSYFALGLVERLRLGPLPLVDDGRHPSNLVHVDNLVDAILTVLRAEKGSGERYFVNETRPVSWRELFDDLSRLLGIECSFVPVRREDVVPLLERTPSSGSWQAARILLSGEFRRTLAQVPPFGLVDRLASAAFRSVPDRWQTALRQRLMWPVHVPRGDGSPPLSERYVAVQVRRFYHSPRKLQLSLGWEPPLSYEQGLETLVAWLRFASPACNRAGSLLHLQARSDRE